MVFFLIFAFSLANIAVGGQFSVTIDRPTLVGISYGTVNVPGPFQGTWPISVWYPRRLERHHSYTWAWRKKGNDAVTVDWVCRSPRSDCSTSETSLPERLKIQLTNWSNGIYDEEERKDIVKEKVLLDYDKIPEPACDHGLLPDGLSITRHVIGYRDGEEVSLVVYQADDMKIIRQFHKAPLFFRWGRDPDQSYRMDQNHKWLTLVAGSQADDDDD